MNDDDKQGMTHGGAMAAASLLVPIVAAGIGLDWPSAIILYIIAREFSKR